MGQLSCFLLSTGVLYYQVRKSLQHDNDDPIQTIGRNSILDTGHNASILEIRLSRGERQVDVCSDSAHKAKGSIPT